MKKSIKVRVFCLVVAVIILSGAVTAAAIMGSPYETLKKAIFDAAFYENVTVETTFTVNVNGELVNSEKTYVISGKNSDLQLYFDNDGNIERFHYFTNGLSITPLHWYSDGNDSEWFQANVNPWNNNHTGASSFLGIDDQNSSYMRFLELLIDLLVGDLKNNVTMSFEDGIRTIRGTLTESQVPEIVKAAIDIMVEQSNSYWSDTLPTREDFVGRDPYDAPMQDFIINYVRGEAKVDADGNLLYLEASAVMTSTNIFGDVSTIDINYMMRFSDIGTSNPECPIPDAVELLTSDNIEMLYGRDFMTVYFKLDENGAINADSVTTTYPGELDKEYLYYGSEPVPVTPDKQQEITVTFLPDDDYGIEDDN